MLIFLPLLFPFSLLAQNPHPILRSFVATPVDDAVRLSWTITRGNSCTGIRIQRSDQGQFFETIGEIDGVCGSPDADIPYVFQDTMPLLNQVNYYRLELGIQGFSQAIAVQYVALNAQGYLLTYDMTSRLASIFVDNTEGESVNFALYSIGGAKIMEGSSRARQIDFPLAGHARQVYVLRLQINNKIIPVKIPAF